VLWDPHPTSGWTLQAPISAPTSGSVCVKEDPWQDLSWGVQRSQWLAGQGDVFCKAVSAGLGALL